MTETGDQKTVRRVGTSGDFSALYVPVSLLVVFRISNFEEGASEENESFKEALLQEASDDDRAQASIRICCAWKY